MQGEPREFFPWLALSSGYLMHPVSEGDQRKHPGGQGSNRSPGEAGGDCLLTTPAQGAGPRLSPLSPGYCSILPSVPRFLSAPDFSWVLPRYMSACQTSAEARVGQSPVASSSLNGLLHVAPGSQCAVDRGSLMCVLSPGPRWAENADRTHHPSLWRPPLRGHVARQRGLRHWAVDGI